MSDADDGFDKEAERERLREKYEQDQAGRQQTQRMSELLLQGATMTNTHCDECGNPIFRYDGQSFCPICEGAEGATETESAEGEATNQDQDIGEPREGSDRSPESETADTDAEPRTQSPAQPPQSRTDHEESRVERATQAGDQPIGRARGSLARTLADLAQRAEAADDVGHTRELLAAAREAAEALSATDQLR